MKSIFRLFLTLAIATCLFSCTNFENETSTITIQLPQKSQRASITYDEFNQYEKSRYKIEVIPKLGSTQKVFLSNNESTASFDVDSGMCRIKVTALMDDFEVASGSQEIEVEANKENFVTVKLEKIEAVPKITKNIESGTFNMDSQTSSINVADTLNISYIPNKNLKVVYIADPPESEEAIITEANEYIKNYEPTQIPYTTSSDTTKYVYEFNSVFSYRESDLKLIFVIFYDNGEKYIISKPSTIKFSKNENGTVDSGESIPSTPESTVSQTWLSFSEAVESSNDGDTIYIKNNLTATSQITINNNIAIKSEDGKNFKITRDSKFQSSTESIFKVSSGASLTLGGTDSGSLEIDGGYDITTGTGSMGISLVTCLGNLTLEKNCTLQNNYSNQAGGAIYIYRPSVNININIKGNIKKCYSYAQGGAIYAETASNADEKVIINLSGCEISENVSRTNGGGICAKQSVEINMTESSETLITKNSATSQGGAFWIGTNARLSITNGFVTSNISPTGNSIYCNMGNLIINGEEKATTVWNDDIKK